MATAARSQRAKKPEYPVGPKSAKLRTYLKEFKAGRGCAFNFTATAGMKGSYLVPEEAQVEMLELYSQAVRAGENPYLTEKQGNAGSIVIDLDEKYDLGSSRQHDADFIKAFMKEYYAFLSRYIKVDGTNDRAYVFERSGPYDTDSCTKDGVHVILPSIKCNAALKHAAREYMITACKELIEGLGVKNPVSDVIDKAVIETNNWCMYESGKPGQVPYKVTMVLNSHLEEVKLTREEKLFPAMLELFRVCGEEETVEYIAPVPRPAQAAATATPPTPSTTSATAPAAAAAAARAGV